MWESIEILYTKIFQNCINTELKFNIKSAKKTGIDQDIIQRFYIILQAISSGHEITFENCKL